MRWRALSRYDVFHTTSSALVVVPGIVLTVYGMKVES